MLQESDFIQWCKENEVSVVTQELINEIRTSPPSRKVQGGRSNVIGFYPSRKMGMTIQFESHKVELPAIYEMEYSLSTLEYYDQPKPVYLEYLSRSGRKVSVNSTPDFFVMREDEAAWEEWKTEEQLIELAKKSPNRYMLDEEGNWRCPPGEKYASRFGLRFYLRSSKEINWIFQRNIRFLEDYLKKFDKYQVSDMKTKVAKDIISSNFGIKLSGILERSSVLSVEDLYIIISKGLLFADLRKYSLLERENIPLFLNKEMAEIYEDILGERKNKSEPHIRINRLKQGVKIIWDNQLYTVLNVGMNKVTVVNASDNLVNVSLENFKVLLHNYIIKFSEDVVVDEDEDLKQSILEGASPRDIEEANKRYQILKEFESGSIVDTYSVKTIKRWKKSFDEAYNLYGNGFLGLISKKKYRGNRMEKIGSEVKELIKKVISNYYLSTKQMNKKAAYNILEEYCIRDGLPCPSYVTFIKHIDNQSNYTKTLSRKGKRAAYQFQNWYLEASLPRHGDRPFEICHVDHTKLDIELIMNDTNQKITNRPYLTLLTDAYSRKVLAHYITFDPPSFRSNMMILRECVRKHNRLPQNIVVDGGKEFHSLYFDSLCAQFEIIKKVRPPAQARFGTVIERMFGTTNTKFIHNLQGNTKLTREVRMITKTVNPKNNALWTLAQLDEMFYKWIEFYHNQQHSSLGCTPKEQFDYGINLGGVRPLNIISYDESFKLATLPPTPRGTGLVQIGKGVVFNNIWYWNDEFKLHEREKVELKYDPYDVGVLYAYVNKRWIKCISEYYYLFKGKSHKELQMITEEIRYKLNNKKKVTARDIVGFIQTIEENEKILNQSMKDKANERIQNDEMYEVKHVNSESSRVVNFNNIPTFDIVEE
ncbi:DDE-type integrase/transposase/recombinase [Bacillus thuringiensis]|nr:DDE-type integrase/transposase/recombinase [Bacillus thuringiensis]